MMQSNRNKAHSFHMKKIREKYEKFKYTLERCNDVISKCEDQVGKYQLEDYYEQLNLRLMILKIQLLKGWNDTQVSKEIGFYETKLSVFDGFTNIDFSITDRKLIFEFVNKYL